VSAPKPDKTARPDQTDKSASSSDELLTELDFKASELSKEEQNKVMGGVKQKVVENPTEG
jgi:hypothetical protein